MPWRQAGASNLSWVSTWDCDPIDGAGDDEKEDTFQRTEVVALNEEDIGVLLQACFEIFINIIFEFSLQL